MASTGFLNDELKRKVVNKDKLKRSIKDLLRRY
jgi:hypothetical protein